MSEIKVVPCDSPNYNFVGFDVAVDGVRRLHFKSEAEALEKAAKLRNEDELLAHGDVWPDMTERIAAADIPFIEESIARAAKNPEPIEQAAQPRPLEIMPLVAQDLLPTNEKFQLWRDEEGDFVLKMLDRPNHHIATHGATADEAVLNMVETISELEEWDEEENSAAPAAIEQARPAYEPINPNPGEWSDWPEESFDNHCCGENHYTDCQIHGQGYPGNYGKNLLEEYRKSHPEQFREIPAAAEPALERTPPQDYSTKVLCEFEFWLETMINKWRPSGISTLSESQMYETLKQVKDEFKAIGRRTARAVAVPEPAAQQEPFVEILRKNLTVERNSQDKFFVCLKSPDGDMLAAMKDAQWGFYEGVVDLRNSMIRRLLELHACARQAEPAPTPSLRANLTRDDVWTAVRHADKEYDGPHPDSVGMTRAEYIGKAVMKVLYAAPERGDSK